MSTEKQQLAKRNPAEQGGEVPAGWKATPEKPIPVARCRIMARSTGKRCNRWGLRGTTKVVEMDYGDGPEWVTGGICQKHGGSLKNVAKAADAMVEAARLRLIGLADDAVDVIEDIALNGTAENTRLKAAESILDRAGVRGGQDFTLDVQVTQTETAADRARRQLEQTAVRLTEAKRRTEEAIPAALDGSDIIDAEIIEEGE